MQFKTTLLILWHHLVPQLSCEVQQTTTPELDYYEFRLQDGDPLNYEQYIKKILARNKTEESTTFGTAWDNFKENTNILIHLPLEENDNATTSRPSLLNYWNIPAGVQFMTWPPDNETTTATPEAEPVVTYDLTYFHTENYTLAGEKRFYELRDLTKNTYGKYFTRDLLEYVDNTEHEMLLKGSEDWFLQFANKTSSEEKKHLNMAMFDQFTITTGTPTLTTWNPFFIQSEERLELDKIAYSKRMATNNAMREQLKSGGLGGLGGLFGGMIPINLGNLGGLMGGLKPITLLVGGTKPMTSPTTTGTTISRKTFRPRPDPQDFMSWKFLEDGSPRPDMPEEEFIRILKKYGTPPPYHIPPVSIPAHLGEDIIERLQPNENMTINIPIEGAQRDRIHNFINPFIQQHTAMDLLNPDENIGKFTAPSSTVFQPRTSSTTTTTTTVPTRVFRTQDIPPDAPDSWKQGWSRDWEHTTDPFNQENLMQALNVGRQVPKSEELKRVFDILKKGISEASASTARTSMQTNAIYNWAHASMATSVKWFEETYTSHRPVTTRELLKSKEQPPKVTTKSRWTVPLEDKERLGTILNFMFPYIEKKSEIFKPIIQEGKEEISTLKSVGSATTAFDPWATEEEDHTPSVDVKKMFDKYSIKPKSTLDSNVKE